MILSVIRICRSTIHIEFGVGHLMGWPLFVYFRIELEDKSGPL